MTLEFLLAPRAVAVIGAGRKPGGIGRTVFEMLLAGGFAGDVWPVNREAAQIAGREAFASVSSLPAVPDLAVIAVPAASVAEAVESCGVAGVAAVVVLSAGFKETGAEGGALERRVAQIARTHGMRLLGPNCLGLMVPGSRLNASFAGPMVPEGGIAVITQSGALGTAILDRARGRGGLSGFVSLGNRADISESDLLTAFAERPETKVIAGYLESVVEGQRFVEAAHAVTKKLPVVLLKAGVSDAGARAVSSHTGSLAGSDAAYEAAFAAAGIVRVPDTERLFGVSEAFADQPLPAAPGVVIVTNAGGPAVMATDACERTGVTLASLEPATVEALRAVLPVASALYNPVDLLGDAGPERYAQALRILAEDRGVKSFLVLLTPQQTTRPDEAAEAIIEAAHASGRTTLAVLMGEDAVEPARRALAAASVPAYRYPEVAVDALAAMERYVAMRSLPLVVAPVIDADREAVEAVFQRTRAASRHFVLEDDAALVASAYGIARPAGSLARDRSAAVRIANEVGYPVVLKVASPDILHKSDIGGVVLGVADDAALSRAWDDVLDRTHHRMPDAAVWGAMVQKMVPPGFEVIVGMERDPTFGPLLMFGLGGIYVEVLHDVAFRLAPLDRAEARRMIDQTRGAALLKGARGADASDIDAITDVLVRIAALATDFPEIVELDINPLVVGRRGSGALAADIRIGIGG
ncbi:MAG TPA: acetate--CoA ligase family protein [Coriobacteriia bacterium]